MIRETPLKSAATAGPFPDGYGRRLLDYFSPPDAQMTSPVTLAESSDAGKTTTRAMSVGDTRADALRRPDHHRHLARKSVGHVSLPS
jgi:hypothetical protein